jgi:hypothetical protein
MVKPTHFIEPEDELCHDRKRTLKGLVSRAAFGNE